MDFLSKTTAFSLFLAVKKQILQLRNDDDEISTSLINLLIITWYITVN